MCAQTSTPFALLLDWHGPYSFVSVQSAQRIFDSDVASSPGLYIWVVPYAGGGLVYYVGETVRFGRRFKQELARFYDGREWIADPYPFALGIKRFIYKPKSCKQANSDFRNREHELRPRIDQMLSLLRLFVAPLEEADQTRKSIERGLMWDVRNAGGLCQYFLGNYPNGYGKFRPSITLGHRSPTPLWGITHQLSSGGGASE